MFKPDFNISVSGAPEGRRHHDISSGFEWDDYDSEHIVELDYYDNRAPLLNLSIDILAMIIEYLSFRDIIALSLTTKGFRHLNRQLPSTTSTPPPSPGNEALCSARIHQRFLPPRPRNYTEKCPYCLHPLCPPTCSSALFLDTATGIFFPGSLYPLHKAHFRYTTAPSKHEPALTVAAPPKRGSFIESQRNSFILSHGAYKRNSANLASKPPDYMYSTIWCDHHRCPRDLLTQKKSYDINGNNGVEKFLQEYHNEQRWKQARRDRGPRYQLWARWLVGHKSEPPPPLPSPPSISGSRKSIVPWFDRDRDSSQPTPPPSASSGSHRKSLFSWLDRFKDFDDLEATKQPEPVYERCFYESFCYHCLRPVKVPLASKGLHSNWSGSTCDCISPGLPGGCRRCGVTSIRFTLIEVFDKIYKQIPEEDTGAVKQQSYWLFLATDCEIAPATGPGASIEPQRLVPRNHITAWQSLDIVRGYDLTPLLEPPSVGLQDLPYPVLRQIVEYLCDGETRDPHFWAMQSTYCFPKAWRGSFGDFTAMNVYEDPGS
ncbi:hypothetical protein Dda_8954 [Drechslerella dactyloides]|uniref:F-box domain-containing protein n=1 Tax=Drechslerella dactyloides TaxID=74499 RepID=A0AAD6IQC4_DREDA|nr:hypothetical protein Dda_8954 [Drechslerella dactyloides]